MSMKLKEMQERDFNYSDQIKALLDHIKKYWNIRATPKGYKKFCADYTDYKGQGEDETALYEEFKGFGDGGTCSFGFPTRVSLPHVAYDDICQGRNPLNTLIGAVMAYGMAYGQRYEEVNDHSTMNYRMKFAGYAMEAMIFHRYTSLDQEKADLKEQAWKDYMDRTIDMHVTMDKYRDLSRKLTKKRILIQLKHCFGSPESFYKGLRKGGRVIITQNNKLKRRGPLWDHLWKLMGGGQSKENTWTIELKKELREYGIKLTGKNSRRGMMNPDIFIFNGLKNRPKQKKEGTVGRIETWNDVPFSVTADCSEQVLRKDLPMWIGKSDSLDKKIAEFLQTDKFTSGWVFHSDGEEKILVLPEIKEGTDFIEIEIKGTSSGYFNPGSWGGPNDSASAPESDDEREVDSAEIFLYDKEGDLIHQFETQDGEVLATLEDILMTEIAEADIN